MGRKLYSAKSLRRDKYGLLRYRVEDSRIICQIKETHCLVLVLRVGHRKNIYHSTMHTLQEPTSTYSASHD